MTRDKVDGNYLELYQAVVGAICRQEAQFLLPVVALVGRVRVCGCEGQHASPCRVPHELRIGGLQTHNTQILDSGG